MSNTEWLTYFFSPVKNRSVYGEIQQKLKESFQVQANVLHWKGFSLLNSTGIKPAQMTKQQNCPRSNYITLLIPPSHTVFPDMAGVGSIPMNHTVII